MEKKLKEKDQKTKKDGNRKEALIVKIKGVNKGGVNPD